MSTTISSVQDMIHRAGVQIPRRALNARTPAELSLAEKWAVEVLQPGTFPNAREPSWVRSYRSGV